MTRPEGRYTVPNIQVDPRINETYYISTAGILKRLHDAGYPIARRTLQRKLAELDPPKIVVGRVYIYPTWVIVKLLADAGMVK